MNIKFRNNIIIVFVAFAIFVLVLIDYVSMKKIVRQRVLMDTSVEITAYGIGRDEKKVEQAIDKAYEEIARVEELLSSHIADSDISRINSADGKFVNVSYETARVLKVAKLVYENTDGAFDITLGHIIDLWGFTTDSPTIPDDNDVKELLLHTGTDKIVVSEYLEGSDIAYRARLRNPKAKIDLGGIAKGYAIMRAADTLKENGVKSGLVDAGGDIAVIGCKKGSKPFRIGIRSPSGETTIGVINALYTTVVTSGDYERYFIKDGVRYHHILNPKTGFPAKKSRSVTVIAKDATIADALSTALFVMGAKDGIALVDVLDGVEAVIIDYKSDIHKSKGADEIIELNQ
jgi:thiamine biosynthesis lipoprotein